VGPLDRLRPASNSEDRRAAAASVSGPAGSVTQLAGVLAESWGPVWQFAASCGLPAAGPLMLPGSWTFH
jgi:protease-4